MELLYTRGTLTRQPLSELYIQTSFKLLQRFSRVYRQRASCFGPMPLLSLISLFEGGSEAGSCASITALDADDRGTEA